MSNKPKLTEQLIKQSLTHGSKWKHEDPKWLSKSEVIEAIKYSHGVTSVSPATESKTDKLFQGNINLTNDYQGRARKVVFVCTAGLLRSPTAAALAGMRGMNARAAGVHPKALVPLSTGLIQWANQIVFMDREVMDKATKVFRGIDDVYTKSLCWSISDDYDYFDPRLVELINLGLQDLSQLAIYARPGA